MALTDTGLRVSTLNGENARTKDDTGAVVIVATSHEAIRDWGWVAILNIASQKHDAGDIVPESTPPMGQVTTSDF